MMLMVAIPSIAMAQARYADESHKDIKQQLLNKAAENIEKNRKGDASITFLDENGKPVPGLTVEAQLQNHEFLFGCSVFDIAGHENWGVHNEEIYKQRFLDVFNFAVMPTHWTTLEYEEGKPFYQKIRETVEWCRAHNIVTKGHALAWTHWAGEPYWLEQYSQEEIVEKMHERVYRTAYDLRGDIDVWDVVNEATNMVPFSMIKQHPPEELSKRYQYRADVDEMIDYVEIPFRRARQADPDAVLLLNDFGQITSETRRSRFIDLARAMQEQGIPLDGLGLQAHHPSTDWFAPPQFWQTLEDNAALNLPIHITEIMTSSSGYPITGDWMEGTWDQQAQADAIEQMLRLSFGHPAVVSFVFWVHNDGNGWHPGLGLVDENFNPKPVFHAVRRMVK